MSSTMNLKGARAEARRLAEETEEWQVIFRSRDDRRYKKYAVMSTADAADIGFDIPVVECVRPGEGE